MTALAPQPTLSEASRVYAIYCREDHPDTGAIAVEVYGEDTDHTRKLVNQRIDEARRQIARGEG